MLTNKQAKRIRALLENRQDITEALNVLHRQHNALVALFVTVEGSSEDDCNPAISRTEAIAVLAQAMSRIDAELRELGIEIARQ